jgi:hypothetical protein
MPDPRPTPSSPADEPSLETLVIRYLDGQLGDAELAQLNARLASTEADREGFVQLCTQTWELREMLRTRRAAALAGGTVLGDDEEVPYGEREGMNESMVMPAVHETDLAATDEPEPAEVLRITRPTDRRERTVWSLAVRYGWVAAAVIALVGGLAWWTMQPAPAATLAGAANAVWQTEPVPMNTGAVLPAGKPLRLTSGLAELTFDGGVRVILEGPAELTPIDGRTATLTHGKLRARVPHGAEGFRVRSAGVNVTDLGTEFGMSVARAAGVAEVHVFDGKVEVGLPSSSGGEKPVQPAMQLSRDDALRCQVSSTAGAASLERIPARPELFVEDIYRPRQPYAIRGTGAGLAVGDIDPQWTIVADQGDDTFVPQSAYVAPVDSKVHRANEPRSSQWISNGPDFPPVPRVASYRFRTRLDLSGFDPSTVVVRAGVAMDDELLDVRLNGSSTGKSLPYRELDSRQNFGEVVLDRGFVAGTNEVEFVVKNVQANSQLGLRVEWSASGLRAK